MKRGFVRTEQEWIREYERKQAIALGDPSYRLPTHEELYAEHRARDRKRREQREVSA